MKLVAKLILLLILIPFAGAAQMEIKVMSYNIRLDVKSDGENQWDNRKDRVATLMNFYEADFIGGQEVQHHQLQYLLQQLNGYGYIGVGRDDGKEAGEYSCIFYKKDKFDVLAAIHFLVVAYTGYGFQRLGCSHCKSVYVWIVQE